MRRFFRKRFRYHSDEFPRFADIVPEHIRKQTKLAKPHTDASQDGQDIRLDLIAKASGFGGSKQDFELEQVSLQAVLFSRLLASDHPTLLFTVHVISETQYQ